MAPFKKQPRGVAKKQPAPHGTLTIEVHGITFIRTGSCHQCGACGCDKWPCPHLDLVGVLKDGKFRCLIYEHRENVCKECGDTIFFEENFTHRGCIQFPDNPWIRVVREGKCGYKFERADGGSMDDLPFLNGEPY